MNAAAPVCLPPRAAQAHKGNFGKVLLVGGSRGMSGSIALSSIGALHTGSGLVTAAIPDRCLETVASYHPGVMTIPISNNDDGQFDLQAAQQLAGVVPRYDAIGCGPGMTTHLGSVRIVERLLSVGKPLVLDADAVNCCTQIDSWKSREVGAPRVMTPHPGEFQRISGISATDRNSQIDAAQELAKQSKFVIVLKGAPTVVVDSGDNSPWVNSTGNSGMATAGSGDVLTGVVTSLLGQGLTAWDAARLGVWVHGLAGDIAAKRTGAVGMTCLSIVESVPEAMNAVVSNGAHT